MEIRIREAGLEDLTHIVHHRQAMFEEMGHRDRDVLDRVDECSREYFAAALPSGAYRAWLAEEPSGRVVGGGGIVVAPWPGYPGENRVERAWIRHGFIACQLRGATPVRNNRIPADERDVAGAESLEFRSWKLEAIEERRSEREAVQNQSLR